MESIFSNVRSSWSWCNITPDSLDPSQPPKLSLNLTQQNNSTKSTNLYRLYNSLLIRLSSNGNPLEFTELSLKIFEPFIDQSSPTPLFGFSLSQMIFYVDCEAELIQWSAELRKICIVRNFESEFVLIKQIGKGSTSVVYLAESFDRNQRFAVKCIKKQHLVKSEMIENLANEIQILRRVSHPNIIRLYNVYEEEKEIYLLLEYLPKGNLMKILDTEDKLSENKSAKIIKKLLGVLDYLHSQNIVHRDLKLENILMTGEDDFKLIDFGLSFENNVLTNKKCGSPGYIAPEILRGEYYGCKIDIFSVGVITYLLLYGWHPFEAPTMQMILKRNANCQVIFKNNISEKASELIKIMLNPQPDDRPYALVLMDHPWFGANSKLLKCQSIITTVNSYNNQ